MVAVSITASGTNTAGETYSLVCSVTVRGSTEQPSITWLEDDGQIASDPLITVSPTTSDGGDGYSTTLSFDPLATSHTGTYTCRATVGGEIQTDTEVVSVRSEFVIVNFIPHFHHFVIHLQTPQLLSELRPV